MIRRPPRSTLSSSSAASDVYKRQWLYFSHNSCTLTLLDVFSWLYFHEYYMCFIDFECQLLSDFHVFMDIFMFYSLLEGLHTIFQDYHKLVVYFFILKEFSNLLKLFSNPIFENPFLQRADGWATMPCVPNWKSILTCAWKGGNMSYTLDPYYIFNWYHN